MEVKKEQLEGNKVELKVEIEPERVDKALEQAYRKVVKNVSIPGFRKGKVPRRVLEARYGKEVLHRDAFDILVPPAYQEAVQAAEIEPIDRPEITDFYIEENKPATFSAVVEVKPEVELGEYKGLGIEKDEVEVTEEDIEAQLKSLQEQHSQLKSTDKEVVEEGDFVVIDFVGTIDGEEFQGGSAEEYNLEVGSGTFIPGFEEQLVGKKVGEETEVEVTFPEDYQAEDLAGKDAVFKVDIKEIKVKETPELDDEFAKEASEFDTLEELKDDIKERLTSQKEDRARRKLEDEIVDRVTENAEVDVPETLVNNELDMMYQNLAYSISSYGMKVEDYLKSMGLDEESWREENREEAEKRAKSNLVLEAIGKKEGIEVTDEEIDNKIEEIAKDGEQKPEQIKAYLQLQGQLEGLKHTIFVRKVIDFLVEHNQND
ncbi:trigger factor [Halothermothrix orenii]|uniref:Trigger factor n=1 Tax=Halothermothrix orenii (strain H 168 / OCM 544 / DSM 9562) TaxID=373903 RepID=TIG_HALOH|nr:trigger factor [Halothermothrix orenii]B8CY75.1 RecName: Full=Trigger factor; Short=TF; AltName: Full=PPIase [Halothermothrix orenii H 168]ACL70244.1 trigger factor [Halothermothrix orenii H 168]